MVNGKWSQERDQRKYNYSTEQMERYQYKLKVRDTGWNFQAFDFRCAMLNKRTQHPLCHQDRSVIEITRPQLKLLTETSASTGSKHEHRGAVFRVLEIRSNRWLRAPQCSIERDERANYKLTVTCKDGVTNPFTHTQQTCAASWSCQPRTPNLLGVNARSETPVRAGPRQLKIYFCGFRRRFPWISVSPDGQPPHGWHNPAPGHSSPRAQRAPPGTTTRHRHLRLRPRPRAPHSPPA